LEVEIRRTSCGLFDNASAEFVESECDRLVGLFAVVLGFTEVWGRVDTLRVAEKRKKVFLFTVSDGPLVVFWLEFGNFFFFFALRLFLNFFFFDEVALLVVLLLLFCGRFRLGEFLPL